MTRSSDGDESDEQPPQDAVEDKRSRHRYVLNEKDQFTPEKVIWLGSPERDWYLLIFRHLRWWIIAALMLLVASGGVAIVARRPSLEQRSAAYAALVFGILLVCSVAPWITARLAFRARVKQVAQGLADRDLAALVDGRQNATSLPLALLYQQNRRTLTVYQEATRRQQSSAYRAAQIASATGLVVLFVGISLSLNQSAGTDKYIVAGLAALGSLLSAYVSTTFLATHRRADEQLDKFATEPHLTGRLLLAERLAVTMARADPPGDPALVDKLITELMATDLAQTITRDEPA